MGVVTAAPVRGEVWICDLEPVVGHEIRKSRPCLVVSPDQMNLKLGTICVMPLTSGAWPAPFRVTTNFRRRRGLLLADQLRTLDRSRFETCLGRLDASTLAKALKTLRVMFEE